MRINWRETDGPWHGEPDFVEFTHAGFRCSIKRQDMGHLCGYVGVPDSHPLYRVGYSDQTPKLAAMLEHRMGQPIPETPGFGLLLSVLTGEVRPTPESVLDVHGGVTYSDVRDDGLWWFGFDCAHCDDVVPSMGYSWQRGVYRTVEFVRRETERLAEQLRVVEEMARTVAAN